VATACRPSETLLREPAAVPASPLARPAQLADRSWQSRTLCGSGADIDFARAADIGFVQARAVIEAEIRLAELRRDEWQQLGLAALALGASLAMTAAYEPLVAPLFFGGMAMWLLGIRSLWRCWDLVDRLADDRDAYVITAVRAYAARDARMDRRHANAATLRYWASRADLTEVVGELEQLARNLEDTDLDLSPACAIVCRRLLTDPTASPLLNGGATSDLHETIVEIERGFIPKTAS